MIASVPLQALGDGEATGDAGSVKNAIPVCLGFSITPGGIRPGGYPFTLKSRNGDVQLVESDRAMYFDPQQPYPGGDIIGATPGGTYTAHVCGLPKDLLGSASYAGRVNYDLGANLALTQPDMTTKSAADAHVTPNSSYRNLQVYLTGAGDVGVWQWSNSGAWYEGQQLAAPGVYSLNVDAARPIYFRDTNNAGALNARVDVESEIG